MTPENVGALVDGTIFTRGGKDKQYTAIFVGGGDMAKGEAVLEAVKKSSSGRSASPSCSIERLQHHRGGGRGAARQGDEAQGKKAVVLAGTGPVGMRAAALLAQEGAEVTITSRTKDKPRPRPRRSRRASASRSGRCRAPTRLARRGRRGRQHRVRRRRHRRPAAAEAAWKDNPNIELVADVNAQPPLGIEGIEATDKGKERHGKLGFGALGIGGLKLKLHRACIGKLFESAEQRVRCRGDLRAGQGDGVMTHDQRDAPSSNFLDELASRNATPGGGSAAAIIGAMGAALGQHGVQPHHREKEICRGRRRDEGVLHKAEALRHRLTGMIEDDVKAFDAVMGAYGLAKETDAEKAARAEAIQAALKSATDVPLLAATPPRGHRSRARRSPRRATST